MSLDLPKTDSVLSAFPEAAILLDTTSDRVVRWNDQAAALLEGDIVIPPRPFSHYLKSGLPQFVLFVDEVDHRGEAWTRDVSLTTTSGAKLSCELRARPLPENQRVLLLTLTDLKAFERRTNRAAAAETFRAGLVDWRRTQRFFSELENQNQLILNAAGEGIYGVNADGKTTFVNRAAQEMLGWTTEDLLGHDIHSKIHHHHLNGDLYHSHDCPIYRSFRFEQVNRIEDEVFWRKDGHPIRVEYVSTPIYDQQILAGAVVIFRDITERKENERKLRDALDEVAALRDRLEAENAYLQDAITTERAHHDVIGTSGATQQVLARIDLVAQTDATVLITGEVGTGKALVATEIHKASTRAKRPLIHFNCASVSADKVEAELFGQMRGAMPGAQRDRPGKLELAHGGTLFLDDVDALPAEIQTRLLEVLQRKAVIRMGDTRERALDLRVIAATTATDGFIRSSGRKHSTLLMYLNVFPIECLPLRDRPEDIPPLAAHLMKLACKRLNRPVPILTAGVIKQLLAYDWPGNVRELGNVIERAVVISNSEKLVLELGPATEPIHPLGGTVRTEAEMQDLLRLNTVNALRETSGKVAGPKGAAALLGVRPTTLYSRIKSMEILQDEWKAQRSTARSGAL